MSAVRAVGRRLPVSSMPVRMGTSLTVVTLPVTGEALVALLQVDRMDAKIVLRMLIIVFSTYPIPGRRSVTRQPEIFLVHLERIATNADARSIAVKQLLTIRTSAPAVSAARAFRALPLFHMSLHIEAGFCSPPP